MHLDDDGVDPCHTSRPMFSLIATDMQLLPHLKSLPLLG